MAVCLRLLFVFAALLSFIWTPYDVTVLDIAGKFAVPGFDTFDGNRPFWPRYIINGYDRGEKRACGIVGGGWHWHGHRCAARPYGRREHA